MFVDFKVLPIQTLNCPYTNLKVSNSLANEHMKINTKYVFFVDFKVLPFKNWTAHTKMSILKNLRYPSARWSIVDVDRDGVHVVCMW